MEITFKGRNDKKAHTYVLKDELTGRDFLAVRADASRGGANVNYAMFNHYSLLHRLESWTRGTDITDKTLQDLPQDIYHVLYNACIRVEADELKDANSFLAETLVPSLRQELASITKELQKLPAESHEPSSPEANGS